MRSAAKASSLQLSETDPNYALLKGGHHASDPKIDVVDELMRTVFRATAVALQEAFIPEELEDFASMSSVLFL